MIVCEDGKSAPNYFKALKKHYNLSATSVQVVGSDGSTQPLQVVRKAIKLKKSAEKGEGGTEPFDQVWCVIDGDYGTAVVNARKKAEANGVNLAVSTKCFEYWILLHFEENDTATLNCDEVVKSLKKQHIIDYNKGKCDFRELMSKVQRAVERAEKLRKPGIARGELPENQNPCSEIYKLIQAIEVRD